MDFYDNLTSDGVFFFWIAIVLALSLVGLAVFLLLRNRKLASLLKEERTVVAYPVDNNEKAEISEADAPVKAIEEKVEPEILQIENKKEDEVLQIENKNNSLPVKNNEVIQSSEIKPHVDNRFKVSDDIPKLFEPSKDIEKDKGSNSDSKPYQKNVLREISKKMPISPIHIERDEIDDDNDIYTVSSDIDDTYDLEGIDYGENNVSPLEEMEDTYEANDDMKEIVSRMEEEVKPSNIELTDYEKKQEEEAIISYDELQKVKDKIYNLTEEEEDGEFIDELKNFRLDLK